MQQLQVVNMNPAVRFSCACHCVCATFAMLCAGKLFGMNCHAHAVPLPESWLNAAKP